MDNPIYSLYINNKDKCKQKQTISLKKKEIILLQWLDVKKMVMEHFHVIDIINNYLQTFAFRGFFS